MRSEVVKGMAVRMESDITSLHYCYSLVVFMGDTVQLPSGGPNVGAFSLTTPMPL